MICLFGGTFDPIHLGHIHAARAVCDALKIFRIRLVLSARPSHRGPPGATIEQRWQMLRLACQDDDRLVPDDREIRRSERSFTVDTLREVRAGNPDATIVWVIGSDAYALLKSWYRYEEISELAHLVVLKRPGSPLGLDSDMAAYTRERQTTETSELTLTPGGRVFVLDADMERVSAEEIRGILASGGQVNHLLPAAVATYISRYGLYGVICDP